MAPPLRRVHPGPGSPTTIAAAYDAPRTPPADRPFVGVCMVTSLDGSVTLHGASGALGNDNDRDVLLSLRRLADVVIVGAGTARGEGYGPPSKPGQRIGVVTNSGAVDTTAPLFTSGAGFVITARSTTLDDASTPTLRAGDGAVDLTEALRRLEEIVPGVRHVQAEGGPRLNAGLLAADLVDEVALTLSPRLIGGDGPRVTVGAPELDRRFDLAHLLVDDDGFVFGRWTRRR